MAGLPQSIPRPRMRSRARTFYLATLFLSGALKCDVQTVYTFCRLVDDLVDDPPQGATQADILGVLDRWEAGLQRLDGRDPSLTEVVRIIVAYSLSPDNFLLLLHGARMDLTLTHVESKEELHTYSVHVAGSVGMILAQMMGARHDAALEAARDLGVAMQLTNILRDVAEDLDRSRVYLPREIMNAAGCEVEALRRRDLSPAFQATMREIVGEARYRYRRGLSGVHFLEPDARFAVFLAGTLYAGILDKIEACDYDVFSRRVHLGALEKWKLALPLYLHYRFGRPETLLDQAW